MQRLYTYTFVHIYTNSHTHFTIDLRVTFLTSFSHALSLVLGTLHSLIVDPQGQCTVRTMPEAQHYTLPVHRSVPSKLKMSFKYRA